jgi:PhzF family phenazine biosynthesis protein
MKLKQYQIDAFARRVFQGNPAAICPLEYWLDDDLLQAIAMENNLSETAFFVPVEGGFHLRWFTPVREVELCGHATLACAHVLFNLLGFTEDTIHFQTLSGKLLVKRNGELLEMDFPSMPPVPCDIPDLLAEALGTEPREILAAEDYFVVVDSEAQVRAMQPDFFKLAQLDKRGVIVTAPGDNVDFVSRFFAPKAGIPEDPVTGSAHCTLTPYWSKQLGKASLVARQISKRGGEVQCEMKGERVGLAGYAVTFMEAEFVLEG